MRAIQKDRTLGKAIDKDGYAGTEFIRLSVAKIGDSMA